MSFRLLANKGNVDYVCRPMMGGLSWRCGKCKRGVLHSWFLNCKVCKAKVRKEMRDDIERPSDEATTRREGRMPRHRHR